MQTREGRMEEEKKYGFLKVGDTVWRTISRLRQNDDAKLQKCVVVKVARKYLTTEDVDEKWKQEHQYEIATGWEKSDGYSSYSTQLVRSPEDWLEDRLCDRLWSVLQDNIRSTYRRPGHITRSDIIEIASRLKLDLNWKV
jgi:hypothetical protein